MKARHVIVIGAAFFLTACAAGQNGRSSVDPAAAVPPDATPPDTTAAASATTTESAPVREDVQEGVRPAPAPDSGPPPSPETLLGLAPSAVDELLGEPELVRRDGPAEVRLYRDAERTCTFHVFLYAPTQAGQDHKVEYFEARGAEGRLGEAESAECFRAFVQPAATS